MGLKRCYLNITKEQAIERYCESDNISLEDFDESLIDIIEFDDEFGTYDVHEI